jgi:nucleotide-binding universal stress UspA family protein
MYKHILIPTDGSELAEKAVSAGTDYAVEANAKLLFFTAMPEYQPPTEGEMLAHKPVQSIFDFEKKTEASARALLEKAATGAKEANVSFETDFSVSNHPYEAIIDAAKRHGCDAIFMASHGRTGVPAWWYGSQTRDVLTHSDIPTLVYR